MNQTHWLKRIVIGTLLIVISLGILIVSSPATQPVRADVEEVAEVFLTDESSALLYANHRIYWNTNCGGEFNPARSRVRSSITYDAWEYSHYYPSACQADRVASVNIAVEGDYIYWLTGDGRVVRKNRYGGAVEEVAETAVASIPDHSYYIDTSDNYVYWSEGTALYRAPLAGGTRQTLITGITGMIKDLRVLDNEHFFFIDGNNTLIKGTWFLIIGGGVTWFTTNVQVNTTAFNLDENRVYYAHYVLSTGSGAMLIASRTISGLDSLIWHEAVDATGNPVVGALEVDDNYIFWHETRGAIGPLMRENKDSPASAAVAIQSSLNQILRHQLVSSGEHIYWLGSGNTINRLDTNAPAVTLDLTADSMEIIQAIQRPSNDVPLVAEKTTYVRLHGRINSSSLGLTSINPWPAALLYGADGSGISLPGSPILPEPGSPPLLNRATDRTLKEEGFWFKLPPEWTEAGDVRLTGVVNPRHVEPETTYSNNSVVQDISFLPKSPVCMLMVPIRTIAGTIGGFRPDYQYLFDRAQVMMPTSDFMVFWRGGSPMEEYEFPFSSGPYEVSGSDDDSWKIMIKLHLADFFGGDPDSCSSVNARVHRVGMLPGSHPDRAFNGLASGNNVLFFGLWDDNGDNRNSHRGGVTLAHELGHNYGRGHVNCPVGAPDGIDSSYPYPSCQIDNVGPNQHQGFDPISKRLILPLDAGDTMSYAHWDPRPRWPSDYHWERVASSINNYPTRATAFMVGGGEANRLLLAGLSLETGEAEFSYAYELSGESLLAVQEHLASGTIHPDYEFWVFDDSDSLISQIPAVHHLAHDGVSNNSEVFSALLPVSTAAARVDLVDISGAATPIAQLSGGANPPAVNVTAPTAGATISGETITVTWEGSDADGDDLHYTVRYSNDDGASWQVLVSEIPYSGFTIFTDGLPGSIGQSRIEVIASDGLHSASDMSPAFTLTPKVPEGEIFFETTEYYNLQGEASIQQGEAVILHGEGYDDEDGPLSGSAMSWSVSGPISRAGTGEDYWLFNLPPGDYAVTLNLTDSDGNTTAVSGSLTVEPKYVPDSTTPTLDGRCDDSAYLADEHPIILDYDDASVAYVHMIHAGNALWACFNGMPVGTETPGEWVGLRVDVNNSGETTPQSDDRIYYVYGNGLVRTGYGSGSSFIADATPQNLQADMRRGDGSWSAELRIDQSALAGWNHLTGMKAGHYWQTAVGDDTNWPLESVWNVPASWGDVRLGADPDTTPPAPPALPPTDPEPPGAIISGGGNRIYLPLVLKP